VVVGLLVAVFLFATGLLAFITDAGRVKRQRLLAFPPQAIDSLPAAAPGTIASICGKIQPGPTIHASYSQTECVWARTLVQERRSAGRKSHWFDLHEETLGDAFEMADAGGSAKVDVRGASFLVKRIEVASAGTFKTAHPRLQAFLKRCGAPAKNGLGFNKDIRVLEQRMVIGDTVLACGPYRHLASAPLTDGYRSHPTTQLTMNICGTGTELILSNRRREDLIAELGMPVMLAYAMMVTGGLVAIGAFAFQILVS
jgi:hypothetical protein